MSTSSSDRPASHSAELLRRWRSCDMNCSRADLPTSALMQRMFSSSFFKCRSLPPGGCRPLYSFATVSFFLCPPPYHHHAHTFPCKVLLPVDWGRIWIYTCAQWSPRMSLQKWFDSLDPKCTFMWWSTIQLRSDSKKKKTDLNARCKRGYRSDVYFHILLY